MKSPAFQFYVGDFLVGVAGMSNEEVGIYIKLLAYQWERGGLPTDPKTLQNLCNSRRPIAYEVMSKFKLCDDGCLRNHRMESERQKQINYRESRSENAKKRWDKNTSISNAHASTVHPSSTSTDHALQSSSSTSIKTPIVPKKKPNNLPTSEMAIRISNLYGRRLTTAWSEKEIKTFKSLGEIVESEMDAIESYYAEERQKGVASRARRDLGTFLNNFRGEVDRALDLASRAPEVKPEAPKKAHAC